MIQEVDAGLGGFALTREHDLGRQPAHGAEMDAQDGYIRGVEVSYQQNRTFLSWYFENLGVQANYTHLASERNYILTPQPLKTGVGPFTGASPGSFNFTLDYQVPKVSRRGAVEEQPGFDWSNLRLWEFNSMDMEVHPIDLTQRHPAMGALALPADVDIIRDYSNPASPARCATSAEHAVS